MGVVSKLKLTSIGNSMGLILPEEILARLKVESGDELFVVDTPGGLLLTPCDPELEEQLRAGREFVAEYTDVFTALAK
jgi:putative addiction module antidote